MALKSDLMGLGMAPAVADISGESIAAVTATGTTQGGAAALTGTINTITTSAGQVAVVLPSTLPLGRQIMVYTTSATTATVFPPSGGAIDNTATDGSVNVAQGKTRMFWRVSATQWYSNLGG